MIWSRRKLNLWVLFRKGKGGLSEWENLWVTHRLRRDCQIHERPTACGGIVKFMAPHRLRWDNLGTNERFEMIYLQARMRITGI